MRKSGKAPCRGTGKANVIESRPPARKGRAPCIPLRRALCGGRPPACQRHWHAACRQAKARQGGQPDEALQSRRGYATLMLAGKIGKGGVPSLP